jgi:hypothetical protein
MVRILLVLSGNDHWTLSDGTRHPTGYWAEEFVVPHRTFRRQGVKVDVATPGGVRPTVDQVSLDPQRVGGKRKAAELRSYIDSIEAELAQPMAVELARRGGRQPHHRPEPSVLAGRTDRTVGELEVRA